MPDEPYRKREIDAHMAEIKAMFKEHAVDDHKSFGDIKSSIDGLTTEVKKTNGSVRGLQIWKAYITGGLAVLTAVVVPVLAWALFVLSSIDTHVSRAVSDALSVYEITNEKQD